MNIKIGDLVEDCSLMSGVVMSIKGDDISIRRLDVDSYATENFAHCSLKNCGIVKITSEQALHRLLLGKEKLVELWKSLPDNLDTYTEPFEVLIKQEVSKLLNI